MVKLNPQEHRILEAARLVNLAGGFEKVRREIVLDMWAEGKTLKEIQQMFGLPYPQSVGVIIQRARRRGDARAIRRIKNRTFDDWLHNLITEIKKVLLPRPVQIGEP